MINKEKSSSLKKIVNGIYWTSLSIALVGISHDLTGQELIREQQAKGLITLNPLESFLNGNFAGDIGNAFACVFGVPVIMEAINFGIQKSETSKEWVKTMSKILTYVAPFAIAGLFLAGAIDAETGQQFVKWGTPDKFDLSGAIFGTAVALPSILKFRKKVFPK